MLAIIVKLGLQCTSPTVPVPSPFCKHHYHMVYNEYKPTHTHCKTCNTPLRNSHPRNCPQPKVIEKHLQENAGFVDSIQPEDKVCQVCYKSHLMTLQAENVASTDKDFENLISSYREKIPTVKSDTIDGIIEITRWCSWNTDLAFTTLLLH